MKYIQVGDVLMNGRDMISIYPVKVYSADGYPDRGKGFWKNKTRGGHVNNFDPENFISFYEAYNNGSNGDLKVNLGIDLSHYSSIQAKSAPNYDWFSKNDLISLISNSTKQYLKKELEYFEHYPFDYQTEIKKMLEKLEELNNEDGCCLLRLGAGVGFHSITGDYICPNHIMWEKAAGQIKAKTRKLIFKYQREGWSFFPMGFVKIYNEEAWEKAKGLNKPVTDQELFDNERAQNEKTKEDSEPNEQILPQDLLIKQPRQPVTKDFTQLRDGDTVDAKVVRQEGINVVVELFCTNLTQTTWKFRYAAGFPKNSILELKISFPNRKNRMQFNLTYYKAIIS